MRTTSSAFVALVLSAVALIPTRGQQSGRLTTLGDTIVTSIQAAKPEWKYESVPGMNHSDEVIVQQWTSKDESVRVSIVPHVSAAQAAEAMKDLDRDGGNKEKLQGLGDDGGLSWGRGTVSFRKQELTIHVSAVITTPTADLKVAAENLKRERRLCKEFARLVADAIIKV